jgi:hypothetical protein
MPSISETVIGCFPYFRNKPRNPRNEVKKYLNSQQQAIFRQSHYFGWRLAFVRRPLFLEPTVVVYNDEFEMIGVLDPDGQINMESGLDFRAPEIGELPLPEAASFTERRKGTALESEDFDLILSEKQLKLLNKIEKFGWQLKFVRQPVRRKSVPVIVSPKGDKFATLEPDGRIKVLPISQVRKEDLAEQADAEQLTNSEDREVI